MRLGREILAGLIGLAVSLALLVQSFGLPQLPLVPIGPGFYPRIVLIFMAVMSLALMAQGVLAARRTAPAAEAAPQPARAYALVAAAFAIIGGYILLLPALGYRLSTVLFVAAMQAALERPTTLRQGIALAAIAIATSAVTFLVFEQYLLVLLPRGSWTGW
jgi:hypothetical protein